MQENKNFFSLLGNKKNKKNNKIKTRKSDQKDLLYQEQKIDNEWFQEYEVIYRSYALETK